MYKNLIPSKPKITVVTPTFNRANLLPETIQSILQQTYPNFEYIIIDDGSTDDTQTILNKYSGHLKVHYQVNSGEAKATNLGWKLCNTEYFAMVSSDDPMAKNWLEEMVAYMDAHPHILVAYPDWTMIDSESKPIKEIKVSEYSIEKLLAWLQCLPGPGTVIRKFALPKKFILRDPNFFYLPDLESWFRLSLKGQFARVPENLANWRNHQNSTSIAKHNIERSLEYIRLVQNFYKRKDLPENIKPFYKPALSRAYYLSAIFCRYKHPLHSIYYLFWSIILQPFEPVDLPKDLRRKSILWLVLSSFKWIFWKLASLISIRSVSLPPSMQSLYKRLKIIGSRFFSQ